MKKATVTVEIEYDAKVTDPEGLASAMDRLLETALSTPGILDDYGSPRIGEFFVAAEPPMQPATAKPFVVLDIVGGVLQEVHASDTTICVVNVDWDCDGCEPGEGGVVEVTDANGRRQMAAVAEYPVATLSALAGTDTAAALAAAGIDQAQALEPAVEHIRRYVLYDHDADDLATTNVYRSYADAADDADMLNNVIVVPLVVEEVLAGPEGVESGRKGLSPRPIYTVYRLRIDLQLFLAQRALLIQVTDLAQRQRPYWPVPGDGDLLNGLLELTDAIVDQIPT